MLPTYPDLQTNPAIGERGMIDIYLPGTEAPYPFILGIHGGGWREGDRSSYRHFWPRVKQRGLAFVLCSYRLAPSFHHPAQFDDIINVLKWLKREGNKYGLDTERCALLGGSSGGHLVMLAGLRATKEIPELIVKIKALIDYCGIMDLEAQWAYDETIRHSSMTSDFIGGFPAERADRYKTASPINYAHQAAPPVWIAHGEEDNVVPVSQSERMVAALKGNRIESVFLKAEGRGHTLTEADHFKTEDVQFLYEKEMFSFLKEKFNS
ncbi:MAG: alpha/beta hydrolase [Victivallaceae bacterium]|nr:alpha/beta hydrolase [Victivallaceae bacterium]